MRRLAAAVGLFLFTLCSIGSLRASQPSEIQNPVPHLIRFHGTLTNPDGTFRTGFFALTFSLYSDAESGSALWTEVQNVVADRSGHYSVMLGAETKEGVPSELFSTNEARFLGVQVESEPEQPRVLLVSVPYALKARDSELLAGHPVTDFLLNPSASTPPSLDSHSTGTVADGAAISAPVTANAALGASSQNYIVKSDGAGGFLPSLMYDNGTNLGVGTTAPAAKLDVQITSANPVSAINSTTTLTNSVANSSQIVTALNLAVKDDSTANNFSKQTMRLSYFRDSVATGLVDVFDTIFTATPVIDSDAPYTLIGLNMEGPNVKAGKTLGTFYGAMIGAVSSRGGNVTNRYSLVTVPGAGNVGINTLSPIAPLNVVADNPGPSDRASQLVLQGSSNPKLRLNLGIHTESSPAFADMGLIEEGVGWRNLVFGYGGGSVGIGTANPTSRLTVNGTIESTSGGIKFPDGTVQISANTGSGGGTSSVSISSPDNSIQVGGSLSSPTLSVASVSLNKLAGASCSSGNQLQWNGSSWTCGTLTAFDSSIQVNTTGTETTIAVPNLGISTAKLADASVTSAKLADASVTASKLADGSITASKLALGVIPSITSPDSSIVVAGTTSAPTLAIGSVNLTKLSGAACSPGTLLQWNGSSWSCASLASLDSSITIASFGSTATLSVTDQGITTAKLADGSVTSAKLAPGLLSSAGIVSLGQNDFTGEQSVRISSPTTAAITAVNSGTTNSSIGLYSETTSTMGLAIKAHASNSTGTSNAIYALNDSTAGYGIYSLANAATGLNIGVYGFSRSSGGIGLKGETNNAAGTTYGVYGITNGGNYSAGVYGTAISTTAADVHYGVYGRAAGVNGIGVIGFAANTTPSNGAPIGVLGVTASPVGVAGRFANLAATGDVILARNSTNDVWRVDNSGNVFANGTTNVGGADFAEAIQPAPASRAYEPGDLLVISTSGDRQVELASESYSTRVIGIYATKPGVLASRYGVSATGEELPVAMIGIVPAKASAENGPIHRGDLLVSASTLGHVMRATDRQRLTGAIVGKAMQSLDSGIGVIEIAVTLQ